MTMFRFGANNQAAFNRVANAKPPKAAPKPPPTRPPATSEQSTLVTELGNTRAITAILMDGF